ncbi:MAG: DUF4276 family protein [Bacteroidaceae bacterium]|nr:DUF4276 family protein [Bacteroidaceae bacterium]
MSRLVILVEGDSELSFMQRQIIPALYSRCVGNWSIEPCKIISNVKLHKKGGNISYDYLFNDVSRFSAQKCTVITTFLDFFRLPSNFPGFTSNGCVVDVVEEEMKSDLEARISNLPLFIPYIQKYEFEALLFSNMDGFNYLLDDDEQLSLIKNIIDEFPTPEDINGGQATAPSKRLLSIFNYNKVADSADMLEIIGLDAIYSRCPRFSKWFDKLADIVAQSDRLTAF